MALTSYIHDVTGGETMRSKQYRLEPRTPEYVAGIEPGDLERIRDEIIVHDLDHVLLVRSTPVRLSPTEYSIVRCLVNWFARATPFDVLTRVAFGRDATLDSRRQLERHIDNIRVKLGDDRLPLQFKISYVSDFGYALLPEQAYR